MDICFGVDKFFYDVMVEEMGLNVIFFWYYWVIVILFSKEKVSKYYFNL